MRYSTPAKRLGTKENTLFLEEKKKHTERERERERERESKFRIETKVSAGRYVPKTKFRPP